MPGLAGIDNKKTSCHHLKNRMIIPDASGKAQQDGLALHRRRRPPASKPRVDCEIEGFAGHRPRSTIQGGTDEKNQTCFVRRPRCGRAFGGRRELCGGGGQIRGRRVEYADWKWLARGNG